MCSKATTDGLTFQENVSKLRSSFFIIHHMTDFAMESVNYQLESHSFIGFDSNVKQAWAFCHAFCSITVLLINKLSP